MTDTQDRNALATAMIRHRAAVEEFIQLACEIPDDLWETRTGAQWSPAQEAAHLVLTCRVYAVEVTDGPAVTPATFPRRIAEFESKILPRIIAGGFFPRGGVAPAIVEPSDSPASREELLYDLRSSANVFETAVMETFAQQPGRYVRHPYFGALTLVEAVIVNAEHTRHHARRLPLPPAHA